MSLDPLVFIPVDRWSELKSVFKSDWPRSILGLLVLENQESLLKSGVDYGFKVFCPFGDVNNGMVALNIKELVLYNAFWNGTRPVRVMINPLPAHYRARVSSQFEKGLAIVHHAGYVRIGRLHTPLSHYGELSDMQDTYYDVIIQCPKDDTRELEEALKRTSIVDWEKCNQIPVLPRHIMDCVKRLYCEKNLKIEPIQNITRADTFVLDKAAPPYDVRLPPGYSFEFLSLDSVPLVNKTWPHRYPGSEWYYELLITAKLGYGLYRGTELIAWVFLREIGCLGHLYTLEKHRRKGYGELVLKLISNILLKDKKYTVAYCAGYNTNAANLYKKLGFKNLLVMDWCNF